jgi:hypothetical protein
MVVSPNFINLLNRKNRGKQGRGLILSNLSKAPSGYRCHQHLNSREERIPFI